MSRSRLTHLAAVLAVAGLASVAPAQITFTNGSGYVEANLNGTPTPLNVPSIGAVQSISASAGPTVVNGATLSASAAFNSNVTATSAVINGTTSAARTSTATTPVTYAFGLGAPNPPTGPSNYGYFTNFNLTQAGTYNFNVGFNPTLTNPTAGANNEAYGDFQAYLYDINRSTVYSLGGFRDNTNGAVTSLFDPGNLANLGAGTQIGVGLGSNLLNLGTGQYQLYLQSQAYVQGQSGAQGSTVQSSASLTFVAAIPEPASIAVFGTLTVGGLATLWRRRKA